MRYFHFFFFSPDAKPMKGSRAGSEQKNIRHLFSFMGWAHPMGRFSVTTNGDGMGGGERGLGNTSRLGPPRETGITLIEGVVE